MLPVLRYLSLFLSHEYSGTLLVQEVDVDKMVSEEYTADMRREYNAFHTGHAQNIWGWPQPPPPSPHGFIWMPGSCAGWWAARYETLQKRLIHDWEYLEAIEKALDLGWRP